MDKKLLLETLILQLEESLLLAKQAARTAHEAATNEESKPENEYDTRALEAGYLAGAQAQRAAELDEILSAFRQIQMKSFGAGEAIASTALIRLKSKSKESSVLLMPAGGGVSIHYQGRSIQVVTPSSSLGDALIGLQVGDVAEVEIGSDLKEFEVLSID